MKNLIMLLIACVTTVQVMAQNPKARLTSGVIDYEAGRIGDAIEKLQFAVDNGADNFKSKDMAKAKYFLGKALIKSAGDSALAAKYPDALFQADEYLATARELDEKGKYEKLAVLDNQDVWAGMFNSGASAYNTKEYERADKLFTRAAELNGEDLNTNLMLGYSQWMVADTTGAQASWTKVADIYEASSPEEPNKDVATAYLLLVSSYDLQNNPTEALKFVDRAREVFPGDKDLERTELSIYQKNPELLDQALTKFAANLESNPDDNNVRVVYGSLLEKAERGEDAETQYKMILEKEPDHLGANIQLGAYYVNKAAEINEAKAKLTKEADIDAAGEEVKQKLAEAYPLMKKLHELEPDQAEWINQLVSISYYLDEDEAVINEYVKKQQEIMAKQ